MEGGTELACRGRTRSERGTEQGGGARQPDRSLLRYGPVPTQDRGGAHNTEWVARTRQRQQKGTRSFGKFGGETGSSMRCLPPGGWERGGRSLIRRLMEASSFSQRSSKLKTFASSPATSFVRLGSLRAFSRATTARLASEERSSSRALNTSKGVFVDMVRVMAVR